MSTQQYRRPDTSNIDDGEAGLPNTGKFRAVSATRPRLTISSADVDSEINNIIDALNTVFDLATSGVNDVTSVFTRIGDVTAQAGDYTAAQVTNAFDKTVDTHAALTGLLIDDHTIYPLMAGRSGGQTIQGGLANPDDLTLLGNPSGTRATGRVVINSGVRLFPDYGTRGADLLNNGILDFQESYDSTGTGFGSFDIGFNFSPTVSVITGVYGANAVTATPTFNQSVSVPFSVFQLFNGNATFNVTTVSNVNPLNSLTYGAGPQFNMDGVSNTLGNYAAQTYRSSPVFRALNSGVWDAGTSTGFESNCIVTTSSGGTMTLDLVEHFKANKTQATVGASTLNKEVAFCCVDMTDSTTSTVIESLHNGTWFLNHTGTAPSTVNGAFNFNAEIQTPPVSTAVATYTMLTEAAVRAMGTSGTQTIKLRASPSDGDLVWVGKYASGGTLTIDGNGNNISGYWLGVSNTSVATLTGGGLNDVATLRFNSSSGEWETLTN